MKCQIHNCEVDAHHVVQTPKRYYIVCDKHAALALDQGSDIVGSVHTIVAEEQFLKELSLGSGATGTTSDCRIPTGSVSRRDWFLGMALAGAMMGENMPGRAVKDAAHAADLAMRTVQSYEEE